MKKIQCKLFGKDKRVYSCVNIVKNLKKNKIYVIILLSFLLFSCFATNLKDEDKKEHIKKQDFFVQTKKLSNFTGDYTIKKTGKTSSSEDIKISSNAIGRVNFLHVKRGDKVVVGQVLANLEDNIGSYEINLRKSKNALDRANINKQSTIINLDKQVSSLEINLRTLEDNLKALNKDKNETLKKTKDDLDNLDLTSDISKSSLEFQKLSDNIKKLEFDYNSKLVGDNETIKGFKLSLEKEKTSLDFLLNDVIEFSDKLLGVTQKNKDKDDKIEIFLGGKDSIQKKITITNLRELIDYKANNLNGLPVSNLEEEDMIFYVNTLFDGYNKIKFLLTSLEETLNNSIESVGSLSAGDISTYIASINIYQATLQGNNMSLISLSNGAKTFLKTYKALQESIKKQIDLLKKDREILLKSLGSGELAAEVGYNKVIINYNDKIKNLESQIEIVKNNLYDAKNIKEITIKSLNNTIESANISLSQVYKEYSKLTIKSPISGIVKEVYIDSGQEVSPGIPMFSVLNNKKSEIIIYLNKDEYNKLTIGDNAYLINNGESFSGTIKSISNIADENFKYLATISSKNNLDFIGEMVTIEIPIKTDKIFIPINLITMQENSNGSIKILENSEIKEIKLVVGNIYNDKIEVINFLDLENSNIENIDIILNDINSYDKEKFNIVVKN